MATQTTTGEFLDCVRKSGLIEPAALDAYLAGPGAADVGGPAHVLAARMVRDGLLTHLQSKQLLQRKWRGFLIGGRYRLLELLGVGGMGKVFLCEHVRMRNLVALKVLPPEKTADPGALERFAREGRAAATLNHPHLVRAFDVDQDGAFHFLVMEYVRGVSLQALVEKLGPLPVGRACRAAYEAALGLQHAHEHGLVHRDIKPGNILVDRSGAVKVLDMGLARFFHDTKDKLTATHDGGSILGTADYLAPEQAVDSSAVDIRGDVYALGATLYHLLAGRAPFEEGTIAQKMIWHQMRTPPPLADVRADVPPGLEQVIHKMMAKDPADRYQTPLEAAHALAAFAPDETEPPPEDALPPVCPAVAKLLPTPAPRSGRMPRPGDTLPIRTGPATPVPPRPALPDGRRSSLRWVLAGAAGFAGLAAVGLYAAYQAAVAPPPPPAVPDARFLPKPPAAADPDGPTPADAASRQVGLKLTVRLFTKGRNKDEQGAIFFYSKSNPREPRNFTVVLDPAVLPGLKAAGVKDPWEHFFNTTVLVTGSVIDITNDNRPGIVVTSPDQIRLEQR